MHMRQKTPPTASGPSAGSKLKNFGVGVLIGLQGLAFNPFLGTAYAQDKSKEIPVIKSYDAGLAQNTPASRSFPKFTPKTDSLSGKTSVVPGLPHDSISAKPPAVSPAQQPIPAERDDFDSIVSATHLKWPDNRVVISDSFPARIPIFTSSGSLLEVRDITTVVLTGHFKVSTPFGVISSTGLYGMGSAVIVGRNEAEGGYVIPASAVRIDIVNTPYQVFFRSNGESSFEVAIGQSFEAPVFKESYTFHSRAPLTYTPAKSPYASSVQPSAAGARNADIVIELPVSNLPQP